MNTPRITIAVPSLNQAAYLEATLASIFSDDLPLEVFVVDGGSTDGSLEIIEKWAPRLAGWRSHPDQGQAAAINEAIAGGGAEFVCWLNSDDVYCPGGLRNLLAALESRPDTAFCYARCWTISARGRKLAPYITLPFRPRLFASFCFIAQPATLIRRPAWEQLGGLDAQLQMAFDYDLWWRLYKTFGKPVYSRRFVAATRMHAATKTAKNKKLHYAESMATVERHWGSLPIKWRMAVPLIKKRY